MHCLACGISFIFLFSMIYLTLMKNRDLLKDFSDALIQTEQPELVQRYESIVSERRTIYYQGFLLGLVLSLITLFVFPKMSTTYRVCVSTAITLVVTYFYYILWPKSDYMVLHMEDKVIREKWLEVYKHMQFHNHLGFLMGLIFTVMFSAGFYWKKGRK